MKPRAQDLIDKLEARAAYYRERADENSTGSYEEGYADATELALLEVRRYFAWEDEVAFRREMEDA